MVAAYDQFGRNLEVMRPDGAVSHFIPINAIQDGSNDASSKQSKTEAKYNGKTEQEIKLLA